jgi:hypothetical protein
VYASPQQNAKPLAICDRVFANRLSQIIGMIIVCCGVVAIGWLRSVHQERVAAHEIERLGGRVHYAWRLDERIQIASQPTARAPGWLVPGDGFVAGVSMGGCRSESLDRELAHLKSFNSLRWLDLSDASISDAALVHVAVLKRLEWLSARFTRITDAGVRRLTCAARLKWLDLANTGITDASLPYLATLKDLERLDLRRTNVTLGGVTLLRKQLPTARIDADFDGDSLLPPWSRREGRRLDAVLFAAIEQCGLSAIGAGRAADPGSK